jgi:hypothetical protein
MSCAEKTQTDWIEPMEKWINYATTLQKIARAPELIPKKVAAEKVFGSNLTLSRRVARVRSPQNTGTKPPNHWAALCAAHKMVGKLSESLIMERLYVEARTAFENIDKIN